MQHPSRRSRLGEDAANLVVGFPGMHDQRQPALMRGRDMRPEHPRLHLVRAVIVVEIETGLADADDPRMRSEVG